MLRAAWIVFCKELLDALRDRRALLMVVLSSVALGPLVLVMLSALLSDVEDRSASRTVVAQGLAQAPTLLNYLQRQTVEVVHLQTADLHGMVRRGSQAAVLVVPPDFEAKLAQGEAPEVTIVSNSTHAKSQAAAAGLARLLRGFNNEQVVLRLAWRGVPASQLEALTIEEHDLAPPTVRSARLTGMVPFFLLMAVLYGALTAALDTTVGELERGSLEPLLMNPAPHASLVIGKWAAAAAVGMMIAVLGCLSFLPAQGLIRSETLAALFRFGPQQALAFIALLLPLAGALAAVLMAMAIRSRTLKEAQASVSVVALVVSLLPMVTLIDPSGGPRWQLAVPGLAQVRLMQRVLEGAPIATWELLLPALSCGVLALLCCAWVARSLASAAVR